MEESQLIGKEPCPSCGSRDNLARYSDGHAYCFTPGCDHYEPGDGDEPTAPQRPRPKSGDLLQGDYRALKARGIHEETCRHFKYHIASYKGETVQVANYYHPETRELVGQKLRTKDKDFKVLGKLHNALFGWQCWPIGGKKLVITEGEIDALTVSQLQGNKWPVVSLPNGADSVKKTLLANKDYLKHFEEIILMFDMDEPGRRAAEIGAKIIGPRAKIATLPAKDPNETYLEKGADAVITAVWNAQPRKPAGLYTGAEVLSMGNVSVEVGASYPWEGLTQATYGKRPYEMILIGAGTGCGKTDWMKEDIAHNIAIHGEACLSIFLEEPNLPLTLTTVAGKVDGKLYHRPDAKYDADQCAKTREMVAKLLYLFKVEDSVEPEDVLDLIKEAVEGYGVKHVYLDHVTYLLDAAGEGDLAATKKLMRGLNDLNKAYPFTLYYVGHLRKKTGHGPTHEEGGRITLDDFAGGKAITQYANFVFGLERSQQDPDERDRTTLRVLKDRYTGQSTGLTFELLYDTTTGKKTEVDPFEEPEEDEAPPWDSTSDY